MNVQGWSGKFFKTSSKSLAGIAIFPPSFASTSKVVLIVVSKSDADTVSWPSAISNKKLSKIGKVLLVDKTPEMLCKWRKSVVLESMKFIFLT